MSHYEDTLTNPAEPRNNKWLLARIELLRSIYFADVAQGYPITARFTTRARYRFGSISARDGVTLITINQLFADLQVPVFVVDATILHELAHYAHGFGSGLPRLYEHAHRGGVVDKELEKRGAGEISAKAEAWRATHWEGFHADSCGDITERREERETAHQTRWNRFMAREGNRTLADIQTCLYRLAPCLGYTESIPFTIEWLPATPRQAGLSYWYSEKQVIRLHGLLADRRIPDDVIAFELAYWLARRRVGANWKAVHAALVAAKLDGVAERALRWRRHAWTTFRSRHFPAK